MVSQKRAPDHAKTPHTTKPTAAPKKVNVVDR